MKFLFLSLIFISIVSCGKNAHLESEKSNNRVVLTPPATGDDSDDGDNGICDNLKTIELLPNQSLRSNHTDVPLCFEEKGLNEHSYTVILQGLERKILFNAQVVLPFDFKPLQNLEGEIVDMKLEYEGERVWDTTWHHEPQFCQSNNKTCSGIKSSVHDHVNPGTEYTWNNVDYDNFIDGLEWIDLGEDYHEQALNIKWDLIQYFDEPSFHTMPDDYLITIADHQYITNAKIVVKYCQ